MSRYIWINHILFLVDWLVVLGILNGREKPKAGPLLCAVALGWFYLVEVLT